MFTNIWNFIKSFLGFGKTTEVDTAEIERLAYIAGLLVKANNPEYATIALALKSILTIIDGGGTKEEINQLFTKAVTDLISKAQTSEQKAALTLLWGALGINPIAIEGCNLDIPIIKAAITGFLNGMLS